MNNNEIETTVKINGKVIDSKISKYIDYDGEIPTKGKACEIVLNLVYEQKINMLELKSSDIVVMFSTNKFTANYKTRLNALNFEAVLISEMRK